MLFLCLNVLFKIRQKSKPEHSGQVSHSDVRDYTESIQEIKSIVFTLINNKISFYPIDKI